MTFRHFILTLFLFQSLSLSAQTDAERLAQIELRLKKIDKREYDSVSKVIYNAAEKFPILIKDYEILDVKSDFTDLFTKLTQAANPNNDSLLGKSYTSFIRDEAKNILLIDLKGEAKTGFLSIINKITSIPIIGTIVSSNPVASLVTQVISSASNFVNQKVEGCGVCEKTLKYTDAINQRKIDSFSVKIQPFVEYYDKILIADRSFSQNLEVFQSILKDKRQEVAVKNSVLRGIFMDFNSPSTSAIVQINKALSVDKENYREVLDNDKIQQAYATSLTFRDYESNLQAYNEEFSKLFGIYLQTYSQALSDLRKYAISSNYPLTKINELQKDIKTFVDKYAKPRGGMQDISDPDKVKRIKVFQ